MRTTTEQSADYRGIEQQLNDLLLDGRKALPNGPNGHPKAPPPRVAATRKNIRQGLSCPFRHLVEIMDADIDDNVPLSEVNASLYRLIARNEARALDRHLVRERPVPVLLLKAQKEMGELSLASLRLANSPESVEAIEAVLREADDLPPVLEALERSCHLEIVRTSTRPARRLTMESR